MRQDIFEKIESSGNLDFGDIFSKSFELFKKVWVQGFLHILINLVVTLPIIIITYIPIIATAVAFENKQYNAYYDGHGPELEVASVGMLVGMILLVIFLAFIGGTLQLAIQAHFFKVCKQVDLEQQQDSKYFFFFKKRYLGKLLMLVLASFGIALLAMLLCYLPLFYVIVPLNLFLVIFTFNPELSVGDIIKASFKLGNKYWLIIFGLMFISGFFAQLGFILCGIGVFFTASFMYLPIYYVYKDAIGFDTEQSNSTSNILID
ncbi:hypothetical protein [Aquimarina brevivitae]|uniref:Uncharacterized protein n=1 Tax=Aquimarina brevivitae TaxID=323412 RepID=A0A4Q7PGZ5_9FLAO|nr:hypothetical protein [Aquimarina brevivitae]RZS99813.1 hypothetical protein EV197_1040 [Aquimarina brevivitae]